MIGRIAASLFAPFTTATAAATAADIGGAGVLAWRWGALEIVSNHLLKTFPSEFIHPTARAKTMWWPILRDNGVTSMPEDFYTPHSMKALECTRPASIKELKKSWPYSQVPPESRMTDVTKLCREDLDPKFAAARRRFKSPENTIILKGNYRLATLPPKIFHGIGHNLLTHSSQFKGDSGLRSIIQCLDLSGNAFVHLPDSLFDDANLWRSLYSSPGSFCPSGFSYFGPSTFPIVLKNSGLARWSTKLVNALLALTGKEYESVLHATVYDHMKTELFAGQALNCAIRVEKRLHNGGEIYRLAGLEFADCDCKKLRSGSRYLRPYKEGDTDMECLLPNELVSFYGKLALKASWKIAASADAGWSTRVTKGSEAQVGSLAAHLCRHLCADRRWSMLARFEGVLLAMRTGRDDENVVCAVRVVADAGRCPTTSRPPAWQRWLKPYVVELSCSPGFADGGEREREWTREGESERENMSVSMSVVGGAVWRGVAWRGLAWFGRSARASDRERERERERRERGEKEQERKRDNSGRGLAESAGCDLLHVLVRTTFV